MQNTPLPPTGTPTPSTGLPAAPGAALPGAAPARIRPTLRLTPATEPAAGASAADSSGAPVSSGLPTPASAAAAGGGLKSLNLGAPRPGAVPSARPMGLRLNAEAAATTVAAPAALAAPAETDTPVYLPILSGLAAAASVAFAVLLYLKYSA